MSGSIRLNGTEITGLPQAEMRKLRGAKIAMVFQDPMMTLNPVLKIRVQMSDALRAHARLGRGEIRARSLAALEEVGIPSLKSGSMPIRISSPAACVSVWLSQSRCSTNLT